MRIRRCLINHSIRELFVIIILITLLSLMMTYQLGLPWPKDNNNLRIQLEGHAEVNGNSRKLSKDVSRNWSGGRHQNAVDLVKPDLILDKLKQLENSIIPNIKQRKVILYGNSNVVDQNEAIYQSAAEKIKFKVHKIYKTGDNHADNLKIEESYLSRSDWSVLMCFTSESDGRKNSSFTGSVSDVKLKTYQKVNEIPHLASFLKNPVSLCQLSQEMRSIEDSKFDSILPCYLLPDQQGHIFNHSRTPPSSSFLHESTASFNRRKVILSDIEKQFNSYGQSVLWKLPDKTFELFGKSVTLLFNVLLTSLQPLRAYLYHDGLMKEARMDGGTDSYVFKKPISLQDLSQHVGNTLSKTAAEKLVKTLEWKIVTCLLMFENRLNDVRRKTSYCKNCFQLLEIEVLIDSDLKPFILRLTPSTENEASTSLSEYMMKQKLVEALLSLVALNVSVTEDVFDGLGEIGFKLSPEGEVCNQDDVCFTDDALIYFLENRKENFVNRGFTKLYPSKKSSIYTDFLQKISRHHTNVRTRDSLQIPTVVGLSSVDLHPFLISLERFYANIEEEEFPAAYDDLNIPVDFNKGSEYGTVTKKKSNSQHERNVTEYTRKHCSREPMDMSFLQSIHTDPPIKIYPDFHPDITEYKAVVPYDMVLIKLWGFAKSCSCVARVEDKYNSVIPSRLSLGLGENKIVIYVVDLAHSEPWAISYYLLYIIRYTEGFRQPSFIPSLPHQICSLKQDCSLPYSRREHCGLQKITAYKSWTHIMEHISSLPRCTSGYTPGQWLVPCKQCLDKVSCYWDQALWQPENCRYHSMPRASIRRCFTGKKVLFLGDSTNRGIMHYIMEQINGSLTEWDKTHDMKVYSGLNHNSTTFSFGYYPQFWVPAENRPVFDKALHQLIQSNGYLDHKNTILVVGGVHWLAKHHLDVILSSLAREGLDGSKVIIKSLGAGFHQPVDGVHCLSKRDHQKLLLRNKDVISHAIQKGFHVVETFNMTMARYKDFLQGKCACHFHRVTVVKEEKELYSIKFRRKDVEQSPKHYPLYHVEGNIHAIYSEMVINQICQSTDH